MELTSSLMQYIRKAAVCRAVHNSFSAKETYGCVHHVHIYSNSYSIWSSPHTCMYTCIVSTCSRRVDTLKKYNQIIWGDESLKMIRYISPTLVLRSHQTHSEYIHESTRMDENKEDFHPLFRRSYRAV